MNISRSSNEGRAWQPAFAGIQRSSSLLELEAWIPSEIGFISPMVEPGNAMDPNKLVEVCCRCERGKGVWLIVKDHGKGFDPTAVPDPLDSEGLRAEHGRGIHLMKLMMDEVSFHCAGSEVQMREGLTRRSRAKLPKNNERVCFHATNSMECDAAAVGRG